MKNQLLNKRALVASLLAASVAASPAYAQDGSSVVAVFATIGAAVALAGVAYIGAIGAYVVFPWLGRVLKKT